MAVILRNLRKARTAKRYPLNQCALYKIGSKRRLAEILHLDMGAISRLSKRNDNYRKFLLDPKLDPYTIKISGRRWVQEPKNELKKIHLRLFSLLRKTEVPNYMHSAVEGFSYRTNADAHKNYERVLTLDIRKFFPSTTLSRVFDFFHESLHCAPDVARILARLATCDGSLPTGSPLSPFLSYAANKPLFDKLSHLAEVKGAVFTCYVDDLTFSGPHVRRSLADEVETVVNAHGHIISTNKTRFFGAKATKHVTGLVIRNGKLCAPASRFRKARLISLAMRKTTVKKEKLKLVEKLSGLLGEAAYIDSRYNMWAQAVYKDLRARRADRSD